MTDFSNETVLHPVGALAMLLLGLSVVVVPRKYAVLPIIAMACFIAPAQRVVVFGLDFTLLRLMILFAWLRVVLRGEHEEFRWNRLDKALILWLAAGVITYTLFRQSVSALVFRLGWMFDGVGIYFCFRCFIRDASDVDRVVNGFTLLGVPVALVFLVEAATGRNLFAVFGGVPEVTLIREGRLRCQGAFAHPILAGCFWASVMPMMCARWWNRAIPRSTCIIGLLGCCVIVVLSASSTPVMAVFMGLVGAWMFRLRHRMRAIRWGLLFTLVGLHIAMKAPVWHLISRIDVAGGSTGWHRYHLIDQAIRRFDEWWLLGTHSTAHWGWNLIDVTNEYVLQGVRGGAATLTLFILMIAIAFQRVGRLWRSAGEASDLALAWALGVSLFMHVMVFLAVAYFGQMHVVWYLLLAVIGSLEPVSTTVATRGAEPRVVRRELPSPRYANPGLAHKTAVRRYLPSARVTTPQLSKWK